MKFILVIGMILLLIGFWGLITRKNMIKMIISIAVAETGLQLSMIAVGFMNGRTAPILDSAVTNAVKQVVDPVPQALVLTAIVIGVAVNALMLTFVIRLYQRKHTLNISEDRDLRW